MKGFCPVLRGNSKTSEECRLRAVRRALCNLPGERLQFCWKWLFDRKKTFDAACPDCGAVLKIDAATGQVISHTPAPRKRTFEDLETAARSMREQEERKESIFRQSAEAERNKTDLLEKKFAEALRKAKDAPEGKPLRDFDLD